MIRQLFSAIVLALSLTLALGVSSKGRDKQDDDTVSVFIFAGQSNMVGSDSKVKDIERFPPFSGLEEAQGDVRFSYSIGRERKMESKGWVDLQPVDNWSVPN